MTGEQGAGRWPILAAAEADSGVRVFHAEPLHARQHPVG